MQSYDLNLLDSKPIEDYHKNRNDSKGWTHGLPPGIKPVQWPLDPESGFPLKHGFTVLLPEDYRVHGNEYVALSFFAAAPDHCDGMPLSNPGFKELVLNPPEQIPTSQELIPFWEMAKSVHPKCFRMKDVLDQCYATILLTENEFKGELCPPPSVFSSPLYTETKAPDWFTKEEYKSGFRIDIVPRLNDPNSGIKPVDIVFAKESDEYTQPFDKDYNLLDWAKSQSPNHIGGTMLPIQAMPEFGPYYIEFEEPFGGYNFGFGNAQLDIKQMKIDWACG